MSVSLSVLFSETPNSEASPVTTALSCLSFVKADNPILDYNTIPCNQINWNFTMQMIKRDFVGILKEFFAKHTLYIIRLVPYIYYVSKELHWVGGSRKWPVLLTFITVFKLLSHLNLVSGSKKVQNHADVINGWSLISIFLYSFHSHITKNFVLSR